VGRNWELSVREARAALLRGVVRNALRLAMAVAILLGLAAVLTPISALLFAPWAIDWGGGPTLTGTWVGPLRSTWGSAYHLYVELDWEPPRGRTSRATLTGTAWVCTRADAEFRLDVRGDADRAAHDVDLDLEARDSRYRESLPLRGAWHGDTLRLSAFTSPFGPEGELRGNRSTVSSSTTDKDGRFVALYPTGLAPNQVPADSFPDVTLRKGGEDEYRAGCTSLRATP
jgi:hypothetical protein